MKNALQPSWGEPIARVVLLSILAVAPLAAQSGPAANDEALERLSSRGVFEGVDGIETVSQPRSAADERVGWLAFYVIYTDEVLARYAPGGATGARFDLFQFGGFPGAQPHGYRIHIVVRDGCISLVGLVESAIDRARAELMARESAGGRAVENALLVER
ncbi:MAG TPA: BON domain-containing protein [Vicinamibacterales bacterium]